MKNLVFTFPILLVSVLFSTNHFASNPSILYEIEPLLDTEMDPCLIINVITQVDQSGSMSLRVPLGSREHKLFMFENNSPFEKTGDPYVFKVNTRPDSELKLTYQFCLNNPYQLIEWPYLEKNFFIFTLGNILSTPEDLSNQIWNIQLNLKLFPSDFKISSSFDKDSKTLELEKSIPEFKKSMIVGGKDIDHHLVTIHEKPISIVTRGELSQLPSPIEKIKKLISVQRNFWRDNDFPHYLVVLQESPCHGLQSQTNGQHYEFATNLQLPNCRENHAIKRETLWIISHELNHAWFGYKIKVEEKDHLSLLWLIEGFNDYYGLRFALESNLIEYSDYIDQYNDLISYYSLLPINQISNEDIEKNYHKDKYYALLAQLRGHFIAKKLSSELTKKGLSLDNLIHQIFSFSKDNPHKRYLKEDLHKTFNTYLGDELWKNVCQQLQSGLLVDLLEDQLDPNTQLIQKEIEIPYFGFDLKSLIESNIIYNLDRDSPAYAAGLREGQTVASHSFNLIKPELTITIGITEEDGRFHAVSFKPTTTLKKTIPQYIQM